MKWKAKTTSILSIFLLAGGSCVSEVGDFCVVYQPVPPFGEETAAQLVSTDRPSAVAIGANEVYYRERCAR